MKMLHLNYFFKWVLQKYLSNILVPSLQTDEIFEIMWILIFHIKCLLVNDQFWVSPWRSSAVHSTETHLCLLARALWQKRFYDSIRLYLVKYGSNKRTPTLTPTAENFAIWNWIWIIISCYIILDFITLIYLRTALSLRHRYKRKLTP